LADKKKKTNNSKNTANKQPQKKKAPATKSWSDSKQKAIFISFFVALLILANRYRKMMDGFLRMKRSP
jgi:hypothetical protein